MLDRLRAVLGPDHVLTGDDCAPWSRDFTGAYRWQPLAVLRPANTDQVSAALQILGAAGVPVVPVGGQTGLVGGTQAAGAVMLSLARMNRIRDLNPLARTVTADAGVVLQTLHDAAADQGLYLPLWFGARGSAMLGGALSTNAGGSNVLRHGSTRGLCLGLEVVLADGRVLDLMTGLHKDNSGYALRDLFIGAEGTLGLITGAVMKLVPAALAHATAMLALPDLEAALAVLNRLQAESGGLVEACEFMPAAYHRRLAALRPELGRAFDSDHPVTLLVELGATAPRDATPGPDGAIPLVDLLEQVLAGMMEDGIVLDATIARNQAQRAAMWARREAAASLVLHDKGVVDCDVCLRLDQVGTFLAQMSRRLAKLDPGASDLSVAHLGDGNVHYTAFASRHDRDHLAAIRAAVDAVTTDLGGSFSAEHGVGLSKLASMATHKDPVALDVMRALKSALDPGHLLNPGKTIPAKA